LSFEKGLDQGRRPYPQAGRQHGVSRYREWQAGPA
jgi:hypothetical protein